MIKWHIQVDKVTTACQALPISSPLSPCPPTVTPVPPWIRWCLSFPVQTPWEMDLL